MNPAITAIGIANPPFSRGQLETAELIIKGVNLSNAEKRLLKAIYKATGIERRYSVLSDYCKEAGEFEFFPNDPSEDFPSTSARMTIYKENALQLAQNAIKNCLSHLEDFNLGEITHLITVSCTGMYAPGIDIELVHALKLNTNIKRTVINFMGCYGSFNALKVADSICRAEQNAKVLIVSVEICTIHFQKNMNLDNVLANSLFADGAGAVLVQSRPNCDKFLSLENFYCDILPQSEKAMAWQISDTGFDIVLSAYVPEMIESGISDFVDRLIKTSNHNIDLYAIHPGGLKILQACEKALKLQPEDNKNSYEVLRKYGNMSSATILFVLKLFWDEFEQKDRDKNIFGCAFGPGLTLESVLLTVHV